MKNITLTFLVIAILIYGTMKVFGAEEWIPFVLYPLVMLFMFAVIFHFVMNHVRSSQIHNSLIPQVRKSFLDKLFLLMICLVLYIGLAIVFFAFVLGSFPL